MRANWDSLLKEAALLLVLAFMTPISSGSEEPIQVKSIDHLEKEYKQSPRDHNVNYEYCGKLIEVKDYSKAIEVCTLAIETGTENTLPWSYADRGTAYEELGRLDDARKDREKSKQHGMPDWLLDSYLKP